MYCSDTFLASLFFGFGGAGGGASESYTYSLHVFAICPNCLHLVHFVVLLTVPPSAADLYLLFLGLPAGKGSAAVRQLAFGH